MSLMESKEHVLFTMYVFLLYMHIGDIFPFKINVVKCDRIRDLFKMRSISGK